MYQFEKFPRIEIDNRNDFINILNGYVIFIPNENQQEIINFIHSNSESLKNNFNRICKKFFLASDITFETSLPQEIKYRFPILNTFEIKENIEFNTINTYLGISNSKSGLLTINYGQSQFIEFNYTDVEVFQNFITDYINYWIYRLYEEEDFLPFTGNFDENIRLDKETQAKVDEILEQLSDLKKKGELLKVLPIIEKYISENSNPIEQLSRIVVDREYNIFLPDYDLEIKLSHLTKAVYILFLRNRRLGIPLTKLKEEQYKSKLISIYKEISNREDYDKMLASIDDLVDIKTNAIYVHLSRIKSAFTKVLHPDIAEYYYVYGDKSKPKKINLESNLIEDRPNLAKMAEGMNKFLERLNRGEVDLSFARLQISK